MTLPTNDDFANRELSIEELEAIAAGWPGWVHSAVHGIEHGASAVVHFLSGPVVTAAANVAQLYGFFKDLSKA